MLKSGKARLLAYPYQDNMPGMDITGYVAKESWIKANGDVAQRFKRAIERATNYLNQAPKEERDGWVAKFTGMKPEVVAAMTLPDFTTQWNVKSLQDNLDLAVKYKMAKRFDVNTMIWKP
jgi:ABC-type nitrate/sulfonate/bicarbonate transport system substrate-binding protein